MITDADIRAIEKGVYTATVDAVARDAVGRLIDAYATLRARLEELEAKMAEYRDELVDSWGYAFVQESIIKPDGWLCPYMSGGDYAAANLVEAGLMEKHPTEDWYRWIKKEAGNA